MFSLYNVVLALHLLVVAFVVGPLAIAATAAPRHLAQGADGLPAARADLRALRAYAVASVLAPLLGSAMLGIGEGKERWGFGQFWVSASWTLYLVAVVALVAVANPSLARGVRALEAGEPAEVVERVAGRVQAAGGGAALAFVIIIVLMVFKPGS